MPTTSIWLTPPPTSPIIKTLTSLIQTTLPSTLSTPLPKFIPHITLTSGSSSDSLLPNPQSWLEHKLAAYNREDDHGEIANDVSVRLAGIGSEQIWNKRLFINIQKEGAENAGIVKLAGVFGMGEERWKPHLSLVYGDDVFIDERVTERVEELLKEHGITRGMEAWRGGEVWVVDTSGEIEDWRPIAKVSLPV